MRMLPRGNWLLGFVAPAMMLLSLSNNASAQTWTGGAPAAGVQYYYQNIPADVEYDWGAGVAATFMDYDVLHPITGNSMGVVGSSVTHAKVGATKLKATGTIKVNHLPAFPESAVNVKFTARSANGVALGSLIIPIKIRPIP